jgi:predicted  nucleic acid-binding Zn-ribbon protein
VTAPTSLDPLLVLQEHDSALDRLRHRRETLGEREALATAERNAAALTGRLAAARGRRDELLREEQRLDDEAQALQGKASAVERKLYSGEVSSPRELQAMQADVEQLRRLQRGLENRELELMEEREPLDVTVADLDGENAALADDLDRLRRALAAAEAEIDAEEARERAARAETAALIAPALVAEYDRCRARARGVGVARLVGSTCQGCHLSIPSTEVERIRKAPDGTIAHCDNCGCILVP